jgi:hypothetical protein
MWMMFVPRTSTARLSRCRAARAAGTMGVESDKFPYNDKCYSYQCRLSKARIYTNALGISICVRPCDRASISGYFLRLLGVGEG